MQMTEAWSASTEQGLINRYSRAIPKRGLRDFEKRIDALCGFMLISEENEGLGFEEYTRQQLATRVRHNPRRVESTSTSELRARLDNVNRHFKQKAAEVMFDENSVMLLADLYETVTVKIDEFDICRNGVALAKLTAANFVEIGVQTIHITLIGRGFIESLIADDHI